MRLKSREKILLVFVIIAIAFFVFDLTYCTPQNRKISRLKGEIKAADLKLNEFLIFTKGVETAEAEVARLERELKGLTERMLKGEEFRAFLRHLARESESRHMKIISLVPKEEKISLPEERKGTSSFQYRRVTIHMVIHSTYAKLGTYLKEIEELPFLVSVDSLQIEKNEDFLPFLKVTMDLSLHIISL